MTKLEYVISLQEQGLTEEVMKDKVKAFQEANKTLDLEEEKASPLKPVKTNDSVDVVPAVESTQDTESQSEDISGDSPQEDPTATLAKNFFNTKEGKDIFLSKAQPAEVGVSVGFASTNYKYEQDILNNPIFYSQPIGGKEWNEAELDSEEEFIEAMMKSGVDFTLLGHVTKGKMMVDDEHYGFIKEAKKIFNEALAKQIEA